LKELALPSVRASFKKWGCYTSILPKALAHLPNFQKFFFFKFKKFKKMGIAPQVQASTRDRPLVDAWTCGVVSIFLEFFLLPALYFLRKWSTLAGWLQHMHA
jgi:hypothetical protein